MAHKKWIVRDADREKASAISEKFDIDPFVAFLLVSRGIDDDVAVSGFLSKSFETVSPFNFVDMEEASFVIGDAVDAGEKICIYGDYDCDGVTSTALLLSFLQSEGADVFYYIPDRINEGYGMNAAAIDKIKEQDAQLIITVDNGISSVDEAEYIYSLGMRLVITDHHQLGETLPRAEAIVNPHREENDLEFCDYCGVGVVFKLVQAMYEGDVKEIIEEYIDLVAIGTLADVVPLVHENRSFVREGIKKINNYPRPALEAFVNANGIKEYTSGEIVYQLCPKINAMGRMSSADKAVEFLISDDSEDCDYKYEQLCLENSRRQETERQILDDVIKTLEENPLLSSERVIVVSGKGYHHGVTGIVASHIMDRYSKPAFVISVDEDGIARGSARSVDGFNIYEAISACSDDLIRFGGHPLAAGITLKEENIVRGREAVNALCRTRNIQSAEIMKPEYQEQVCRKYGFKDWPSVLAAVGQGGLKEGQIVNKLLECYAKDHAEHITDAEVLDRDRTQQKRRNKSTSGIVVRGLDDVTVRFAKCCAPVPGDDIVGYVTRGRGVTIHRKDCVNIQGLPETEKTRLIDAEWQKEIAQGLYLTELKIYAMNRTGLLVDISRIFTEREIDLSSINCRTNRQGMATIDLEFETSGRKQIAELTVRIRQVESVIDVSRTAG